MNFFRPNKKKEITLHVNGKEKRMTADELDAYIEPRGAYMPLKDGDRVVLVHMKDAYGKLQYVFKVIRDDISYYANSIKDVVTDEVITPSTSKGSEITAMLNEMRKCMRSYTAFIDMRFKQLDDYVDISTTKGGKGGKSRGRRRRNNRNKTNRKHK